MPVRHEDDLPGLVVHQSEHRELLVAVLPGSHEIIDVHGVKVGVHAAPKPMVIQREMHGVHPLVVMVAYAFHFVPCPVIEQTAADLVLRDGQVSMIELVVVTEGKQAGPLAERIGQCVIMQVETDTVNGLEVNVILLKVTLAPVGATLAVALLTGETALCSTIADIIAELLPFRRLDINVHMRTVLELGHSLR